MFRTIGAKRPIRDVLSDRTGAGIAEGLGGAVLLLFAVGALSVGIVSNMSAFSTIAVKAERQAVVSSLIGDEYADIGWGTKTSPKVTKVTLPNGHAVDVTTWREDTPTSTRLTATTPISADADAADCTKSAATKGCVYASRLHAKDMDYLSPPANVRKSAGVPTTGTVDSRVGTAATLPQGAVIAKYTPSGAAGTSVAQRYLIEASSADRGAEIIITRGSTVLAKLPIDAGTHAYYGTFATTAGQQVRVSVASGNAKVSSVFVYNVRSAP